MELEQMQEFAADLDAEAIAQREAQRAFKEWAARRVMAKRIKARRRRLGQNGFAFRKMAVPKAKPYKRSRNSQ